MFGWTVCTCGVGAPGIGMFGWTVCTCGVGAPGIGMFGWAVCTCGVGAPGIGMFCWAVNTCGVPVGTNVVRTSPNPSTPVRIGLIAPLSAVMPLPTPTSSCQGQLLVV